MAAKMQFLNEAMLNLDMGAYQWYLVMIAGLGWFSGQPEYGQPTVQSSR